VTADSDLGDGVVEIESGPSRLAFWLATVAALVLGLFVIMLATSDGNTGFGRSPLIGKEAPMILGQTIEGEQFDLADQRGRWVVVNFFATTCIPCIVEHPELVSFQQAHAAAGDATVVSLAFSDSAANVTAFFAEFGGDWPVLATDTGRYAVSYGVAAVPETYLVSPNGVVMKKLIGGVTEAGLDALIAQLSVGGRPA